MQQAIPFRTWAPSTLTSTYHPTPSINNNRPSAPIDARKLATENALIVFGRRGCCMCHVVKRLLVSLGVNPAVHEVDESEESELIRQLMSLQQMVDLNQKSSGTEQHHQYPDGGDEMVMLPVVFVGGRLFGGLDRLMATHISGDLVPALKRAGALWL